MRIILADNSLFQLGSGEGRAAMSLMDKRKYGEASSNDITKISTPVAGKDRREHFKNGEYKPSDEGETLSGTSAVIKPM